MARTDVLTTAQRIRRQMQGQHRLQVMQLNSMLTDSATSFITAHTLPASVRAGVVLECGTELMFVVNKDVDTNTVTVIRGYLDSDAAEHPTTELLHVAPNPSLLDIVDAMVNEINSWSPQLYWVNDETLTVATTAETAELSADMAGLLGVVRVLQSHVGTDVTTWPRIGAKAILGTAAGFTGATTSGALLRFTEPVRSGSVYVQVAMPFSLSTIATDDDLVTDHHVPVSALDVLELGVARRLLLSRDNTINDRQPQDESRQAEENPIGGLVSVHSLQLALYRRRMSQEASRLRALYPITMD